MKRIGIALSCSAMLASGCAWSTADGRHEDSRGAIPAAVRASFVPSKTTRADVLCALGLPEWIDGDESRFVYRSRHVEGSYSIYLVAGLGVTEWGTREFEAFEFDDQGVLRRHRRVTEPYEASGDGGPTFVVPTDAQMAALFDDAVCD